MESEPNELNIPTRHNNPLNLKYGGLTKKYVESGEAVLGDKAKDGGRFLKFKNAAIGFKAAKDLLFNNFYKDLNVESALRKWSHNGYGIATIAKHIKPETRMEHLQEADRDKIVSNMARMEGFKPGLVVNPPQSTAPSLTDNIGKLITQTKASEETERANYDPFTVEGLKANIGNALFTPVDAISNWMNPSVKAPTQDISIAPTVHPPKLIR